MTDHFPDSIRDALKDAKEVFEPPASTPSATSATYRGQQADRREAYWSIRPNVLGQLAVATVEIVE